MACLTVPDSVHAQQTVKIYTDKKQYELGDTIHVTGQVNFVDGKAIGIGLPPGMSISLEVYDSKGRFVTTLLQEDVNGSYSFDVATGVGTKIDSQDQYHFIVYYGLVNDRLKNSEFVGNLQVNVGMLSDMDDMQSVSKTTPDDTGSQRITPVVTPAPTKPIGPFDTWNWSMILGIVIVAVVVAGSVFKKFISSGYSSGHTTYGQGYSQGSYDSGSYDDDNYEEEGRQKQSKKESDDPLDPTYEDIRNNFERFTWEEAEDLTGKLFKAKGYSVTIGVPTKYGGRKRNGDFGIDVRANNGLVNIGIQVKHQASDVEFGDVAKTLGVAQRFQKVVIVSVRSGFTKQSWEHAEDNSEAIELWDSEKFKEEITQYLIEGDNSNFKESTFNSALNYYEILGISNNATQDEIKKRYRELSLKFHPDKESSLLSEENMMQINEAYDILKDVEKRRQYDSEL